MVVPCLLSNGAERKRHMSILNELRRLRGVFVKCPNCEEEFPLRNAQLFDATVGALPELAETYLSDQRAIIREERSLLVRRLEAASTKPRIGAESGTIGKVVEKVAPSLPGFPAAVADCRSLFEPIDYMVFQGLAADRRVSALLFVDVKSGRGRLTEAQQAIKRAVEEGAVKLVVAERVKGID